MIRFPECICSHYPGLCTAHFTDRPATPPEPAVPRCTVCGAQRIVNEDGRVGACSLVPGRDGKGGCPSPLHDYDAESFRLAAERIERGDWKGGE